MTVRNPRRDRQQGGFTLLEVVVAFVIAALALGVLFQGALGALRIGHVADRTEQALSRARSHLATVGHGIALRPTTQEGDDGSGFRWLLAIRPVGTVPVGGGAAGRLVLYAVRVEERWTAAVPAANADTTDEDASESVVLNTQRVGSQPGGGER
ncbi:MAG: type II secretion system protein [Gluconacetobacter diazotrophicus]|nr:type II secretion system protein [Gluconacetobacter diazotrophicus]